VAATLLALFLLRRRLLPRFLRRVES
jgi:hypothetical protein